MPVPQIYRSGGSEINATYDYFDVASNIGYITFYGFSSNEGDKLITETIESNSGDFYKQRTTDGSTEYNLDFTFKKQMTIGAADAFFSGTIEVLAAGATGSQCHLVVRLLHVDNAAAETEIAAAVTSDVCQATSGASGLRVSMILATSEKTFHFGEKLRLEIVFTTDAGSGAPLMRLYMDPANRGTPTADYYTSEVPNTHLKLQIPFKVII